ncbi:hypothetical protein LWI29_030942 [Acer saccharum]|uniref:Uncharacterized protein n=1 Tax=Acer saccharum TaxID=4024 RepID=A0AA39RTJ1_ACESA|nr:hypothetical protein LWI29_030942 [Acer saccharum]
MGSPETRLSLLKLKSLHGVSSLLKTGGWTEVKDTEEDENLDTEDKEIVPDETIHEVAVGKGLSGALKLLKDRGTLKESIEWGGRNIDKKKSKLVGIVDDKADNDIDLRTFALREWMIWKNCLNSDTLLAWLLEQSGIEILAETDWYSSSSKL